MVCQTNINAAEKFFEAIELGLSMDMLAVTN
jgi:hypothetical protein